jgi:hypothetical protein
MQTRHVVLTVLALSAAAAIALAFLGSKGDLPPTLADAYGNVASLASSASAAIAASRSNSDGADAGDAGDAGPVRVRRTTQAAPLSSAQLGAPLVHGKFVSDCGAPDAMKVIVKVTIKGGRAIAVAATTTPPDAPVASCVEKATRAMQWDVSPKTQSATVTY